MSPARAGAARTLRAGLAVLLSGALGLTLLTAATPASADDLSDARAKAARLAAEVQALEVRTEAAIEDYNAVAEQLGAAVSEQLVADQKLDALRRGTDQRRSLAAARVRALYMNGGAAGLYASVLSGGDPVDVLQRIDSVSRVVSADTAAVAASQTQQAQQAAASARLADVAAQRARLEDAASAAARTVKELLDQRNAQLAAAGAQVRALAEEAQRRADAEAAARSAALLAPNGGDWTAPTDAAIAAGGPVAVALTAARSKLGVPYVWGATGPDTFDCSGLTGWAYRQAGVSLPRTAQEQWNAGRRVDTDALAPGDLLFFATDLTDPASIHHVAIYVGNGWMLHAPRTGLSVMVSRVPLEGFIGAVRPA